jgi:putative oxidoreductase
MSISNSVGQKIHQPDLGLLVIRLAFGVLIATFGIGKLMAGKALFVQIGSAMAMFGIHWHPAWWGLMCALVESCGGVLVVLGLFFRPAAFLLVGNMAVACATTWKGAPDFSSGMALMGWAQGIALPVSFFAVFLGLLFTGPGRFAAGKSG